MRAVNGHRVVVKLTDYGNDRKNPEGTVTEILGHADDPKTDILAVVKAFDLPTEFPEGCENTAFICSGICQPGRD